MQVQSTNGVVLALHDLGGEGSNVIACHATGFHGRCYEPFSRELRGTHHVWAVDFRGHGASTEPDHGSYEWSGMARDVLACIDALGGEPVFAVGHSMGGASILLAELARPGSIRAAYLYEPIVVPEEGFTSNSNPLADSARRRREVFGSRAEALYRYAGRPPLGELRADALAAYVEHGFHDMPDGTIRLACRGETEARTFEANGAMRSSMAKAIASPVVVAAGQYNEEGPNPAAFAPTLVDALPSGRLQMYEYLGHFGPLQDPHTTARDAAAFFAEVTD